MADFSCRGSTPSLCRVSSAATSRSYTTADKKSPSEKVEEASGSATSSPTESQAKVELLTAEVEKLKVNLKDFEDKYKRALADGENIRTRMAKQIDDTRTFAIQSFCKDLLEVADTLSMAVESVPANELANASAALRALHDGVRLTDAQLRQVFSRHGLVQVHPLKEKFDPNLHEALFTQEVEGATPGTVVTVSKVGYKLHDRCVRPALVGVAKAV